MKIKKRGKELKVPHYPSAAAVRDGNLPYIIAILLRDTPVTPYTRLPVSTDLAIRDRLRDCRNLRQSTAICHILPSLPNSAKFCQDHDPKPILPRVRVNWVTKLMIYTLSSRFLIFFFYVMSWFYHTVHIHSLIISTLLYIIATCTYSVTLYCVNHLYYCTKYRMNLKPL